VRTTHLPSRHRLPRQWRRNAGQQHGRTGLRRL